MLDQTSSRSRLIRRRGACGRCKDKKARCDGLKPSCSACTRAGNTSCGYDDNGAFSARSTKLRRKSQVIQGETTINPQKITPGSQDLDQLIEEDGVWGISVADTGANSDSITVTQSDNACQQENGLNNPLTGNSGHQIARQIDMVNENLAEDEAWDMSVHTHKRVDSDLTNITQSDDSGQQSQFSNMPSISDPEMTDISSMNMLPFTSFLEYSLGFNSVNILETSHDNWDLGSHLNSQMQEPSTVLSNGWLNETPSRMKTLSQRLFPAPSNMTDSIDTKPECEKMRIEFGLDSSILSTTLQWLTSLPAEDFPNNLPIAATVRDLVQKLQQQPTQLQVTKSSHFSETVIGRRIPIQVLHQYIDAFFDHPLSCYFTPDDAREWLGQYLSPSSSARPCIEPLMNGVFAIGCRAVHRKGEDSLGSAGRPAGQKAEDFFSAALASRGQFFEGPPSVLKIQCLVTWALYLDSSREEELTYSIICQAVQFAMALKLNRSLGIQDLARTEEEAILLRRLFWIMYSIEKPLVMRLSRYSFIDDTSINHVPDLQKEEDQPAHAPNKELFLLHITHYARICSIAMKLLYSFTTRRLRSDIAPLAGQVLALLNEWKECLPQSLKVLPQGYKPYTELHHDQMETMVDFTLKYHEAVFVIHQKGEICIQSAQEILSLTNILECNASRLSWANYRLIAVAYLIVLIGLVEVREWDMIKARMPYVFIANGWFGRLALSLDWDFGFSEFMDLTQMAQTIWKSAQNARGEHGNQTFKR